jgi:hypothetical protein
MTTKKHGLFPFTLVGHSSEFFSFLIQNEETSDERMGKVKGNSWIF